MNAWGQVQLPPDEPAGDLRVDAELWPTRSDVPVRVAVTIPFLGERPPDGTVRRLWLWSSRDE